MGQLNRFHCVRSARIPQCKAVGNAILSSKRILKREVVRRTLLVRDRFRCDGGYNFRYSLSRRVCVRLTGISVDFSSFIRRM